MLKKFAEGLIFGAGFAVSFIVVSSMAAYFIYPIFINSEIEHVRSGSLPESNIEGRLSPPSYESFMETGTPFHELSLEEQIQKSSVIALARYEPSEDGKMTAVIKEILKKDEGVSFDYNKGDEYPSSSYYPKEKIDYGDGVVIFFTGSPAMMRMSMAYSGDRIRGLGDLPLELLRKKCREPNA